MTEQKISKKPFKKLVALDFDGVLHSYTSPWTDAATISDPPTPGAIEFLYTLTGDPRFEVVIVSSRLSDPNGQAAVVSWIKHELFAAFGDDGVDAAREIRTSATRPPAFVTIDDRAWTFEGVWPSLDAIAAFKPWNKRPAPVPASDRLTLAMMRLERLKAARREGVEVEDRELTAAKIEVVRLEAEVLEEALPERARRYAAARGQTVKGVLADPAVLKVGHLTGDVETEEVWTVGAPQPLSHVVTERGASSSWLDAAFVPYAAVEALIVSAVPPGTAVTRASAGGDLGWRVGHGWMSVEGSDPSRPDLIRTEAKALAAIPATKGEKPRAGNPDLVERVLAAGRAE